MWVTLPYVLLLSCRLITVSFISFALCYVLVNCFDLIICFVFVFLFSHHITLYTECFMNCRHYCRKCFPRFLR